MRFGVKGDTMSLDYSTYGARQACSSSFGSERTGYNTPPGARCRVYRR